MEWLDNLTNSVFGTETPASDQPSPLIPQSSVSTPISLFDPNAMLSPQYSLKDLTATNQSLSAPNMPSEQYQFDNLITTAQGVEFLENKIGPIRILSGFRTKELQNALSAAGEPTSFGKSYHELGRAVDFAPTTMSLDEYFGKMLADEEVRSMFAEIAYKPGQGSIHAAFNVPGDVRETKVLGLNADKQYARLSLDEIANFIKPYMASVDEAYNYAAAKLVTQSKTPMILAMVAAAGGLIYLAFGSRSRGRSL